MIVEIIAVTGQAGSGKTTWLMQKAKEAGASLQNSAFQKLLVITRMHGSRRRLSAKLSEECPGIPCRVATIDSFALWMVNRWRRSLGIKIPICPVQHEAERDSLFGFDADFDTILRLGSRLLDSETVRRVLAATYPFTIIDEFQDCRGTMLTFVQALSRCTTMIVAGDDFQLLELETNGCPAIDWLRGVEAGRVAISALSGCPRTSVPAIVKAAAYLRENVRSLETTVPVVCCASPNIAGFKILEAIVYRGRQWAGTTALITPTNDPFLEKALSSCNEQLRRKGLPPLNWLRERGEAEEQEIIMQQLAHLGPAEDACLPLNRTATYVLERARDFCRLKGLRDVPTAVISRHAEMAIHERRSFSPANARRIVTTIYGAKNREFDNVIVIWPYKVKSNAAFCRRLLYNAVTRAKTNCLILVQGSKGRAMKDPTLALLGPAVDAFSGLARAGRKAVR